MVFVGSKEKISHKGGVNNDGGRSVVMSSTKAKYSPETCNEMSLSEEEKEHDRCRFGCMLNQSDP